MSRFSGAGSPDEESQIFHKRRFWLALFKQSPLDMFFDLSPQGAWKVLLDKRVHIQAGAWNSQPHPPQRIVVDDLSRLGFAAIEDSQAQSWVEFPQDWELAPKGTYDHPASALRGDFMMPVLDHQGNTRGFIAPIGAGGSSPLLTLYYRFEKLPLERRKAFIGWRYEFRLKDRKSGEVISTHYFWGLQDKWPAEKSDQLAREWLLAHYQPNLTDPFWGWD